MKDMITEHLHENHTQQLGDGGKYFRIAHLLHDSLQVEDIY